MVWLKNIQNNCFHDQFGLVLFQTKPQKKLHKPNTAPLGEESLILECSPFSSSQPYPISTRYCRMVQPRKSRWSCSCRLLCSQGPGPWSQPVQNASCPEGSLVSPAVRRCPSWKSATASAQQPLSSLLDGALRQGPRWKWPNSSAMMELLCVWPFLLFRPRRFAWTSVVQGAFPWHLPRPPHAERCSATLSGDPATACGCVEGWVARHCHTRKEPSSSSKEGARGHFVLPPQIHALEELDWECDDHPWAWSSPYPFLWSHLQVQTSPSSPHSASHLSHDLIYVPWVVQCPLPWCSWSLLALLWWLHCCHRHRPTAPWKLGFHECDPAPLQHQLSLPEYRLWRMGCQRTLL